MAATKTTTATVSTGTGRGLLRVATRYLLPGWLSGLALIAVVPAVGQGVTALAEVAAHWQS